MATITIPCVDSMTIDPGVIYGPGSKVYLLLRSVLVNGVYYDVRYHGSQYVYAGTSGAGTHGPLGDPGIFLFQQQNLDNLDTSNVINAKLVLFPAAEDRTSNGNLVFSVVNQRPVVYENTYIMSDAIYGYSDFYTYTEATQPTEALTVDLTGNIDIIKRLVSSGLMVYSGKYGRSTVLYNFQATSLYQPYIQIEYLSDETPPIVTPASPVSDVVNGDQPITFTWNYSQDVNEPQSHYSIQYQSSGDWTTLISKTAGTTQTATVAANSLPAGQVAWRVMAWSQNGTVQSEWSEPAYIIVQSQPKAPNITSAGTSPTPTFTWQASQQQGYEIKLGDYYDAIRFGVEKSWTYPGTLPDGNVTFQIRIQNAQGIWSPWAGVETYISNASQGTLSLSANVLNQSVSLMWTGTGFTSSQYNVYRDGELIATVSGTSFTDYYSAGKHTYQVYAMLSGGYYTPSNAITEILRPKYAMISLVSSISWIPLRIRSGGRPTYSSENQAQASFVHYQGRVLPVAYTTGFLDKSYSYSFSFLRKEDMQTLAKLCGQMVILKTPAGERVVGILTGISDSRQQRINDFSFSITESDFSEVDLNAANNVEVSSFP